MPAHIEDGRLVKIEGDPDHPWNQGRICARCLAMTKYVYHPDRLTKPLLRAGERARARRPPISSSGTRRPGGRWYGIPPRSLIRHGLLIDYEHCTGCHTCEIACAQSCMAAGFEHGPVAELAKRMTKPRNA